MIFAVQALSAIHVLHVLVDLCYGVGGVSVESGTTARSSVDFSGSSCIELDVVSVSTWVERPTACGMPESLLAGAHTTRICMTSDKWACHTATS